METKLKEIEKQMDEILARNSYWKSCQDGSYEMALSHAGYYKLWDEYRALKEQLENSEK